MHPVLFEVTLNHAAMLLGVFGAGIAVQIFVARARLIWTIVLALAAVALSSQLPPRTLPVYAYGVMLGASVIAGWAMVLFLGRRFERLQPDQLGRPILLTGLFALVGARFLFVLTNPALWAEPGRWFALAEGGMVAYGGFLGGLFGGWIAWRGTRVSLLTWGDLVAPTLGLGLGLTRIGCYLYGCDFGVPLGPSAPAWLRALGTFPRGSPAFTTHVTGYGLSPDAIASLPVHPTELYESVAGLLIFLACLRVWRTRRFPGQVLFTFAALYGTWRFGIEWLRDDPQRGAWLELSTSQLISLAIVPLTLVLWRVVSARAAVQAAPARTSRRAPRVRGAPSPAR